MAADLVGPEGQCAAAAGQGFAEPGRSGGRAAAPLAAGGIALQMTECDVVRRAGVVDKVEFGVNERGERAVVLTYRQGSVAGRVPVRRRTAGVDRARAGAATRARESAAEGAPRSRRG